LLGKVPENPIERTFSSTEFYYKTGKKMTNFTFLKSRIALLFIAVASLSGFNSHAQQEAMFSQYMFNTLLVNPAYAGSRDVLSLTALGRYQWAGVEGAPQTYTLSVDMPFKNEKMGIGFTAFSDRLGTQNNLGGYLTYAYRVRVGAKSTLSFGVQGGIDNIQWALQNTQNINSLDPVFISGINKILPNVGGGLYLSNDRGYIGLSVPRIMRNPLFSSDSSKQSRHYYAMMGLVFGKGAFKVKPSMMVRYTNGANLGVDGNINFWIKDKIAFGVSGRTNQFKEFGTTTNPLDAVIGMLELQLTPQLRLGYAYDMTLNKLGENGKVTNGGLGLGTHEGMLRYEFGFGKNKILTPRYF
jgi:type IX secretion system PorP/SprF family membrane protein